MAGSEVFGTLTKDDWWGEKGRLKSIHLINRQRFEYFRDVADKTSGGLEGKRILDIGCGGGVLSEEYAKAGAKVTGIDLSPASIDAAKEHAKESGLTIDYRVASIAGILKENTGTFDIVSVTEVVEHVDDLPVFVRDAASALSKGGLFFFSTINRTLKARFLVGFVAEDVLGLLPPGTHDTERFVRPSELARLLRENSVTIEDLKGLSLNLLSRSFKLSNDLSVNYLGYGRK
ncbi:MAG: bifunctional 2-polyprenyl-6-hydroxyphenol methylase/3-demethylubiquinol 3-O-methyltransferase UbiG [Deltaproteobacteria bacterium]|nr:bifunctional 2-polyprenyl-6-hydroxyphenol methylase/3-demethylubiquinol 3-O-methyltransferase UbiG [Deltaproteobacteria bacterium]